MTRIFPIVVLCTIPVVVTPVAEAQFRWLRRSADKEASAEERRKLDVLDLIMEDAERTSDEGERTRFYEEYLETSEQFVIDHPDSIPVWAGRALAAAELNRSVAAWTAGQSLLRLEADETDDLKVRRALATLDRRGWLGPNAPRLGPSDGEPWENSLGMKFVAIEGTDVFFCVWETRVLDFAAFAEATGHDATSGMLSFYPRESTWKRLGASWRLPGFDQSADHPVVGVNWFDARSFCAWLTEKERKEGIIAEDQEYRLPTDSEWSLAAGNQTYAWGEQWPPPVGAGNFLGEENQPTELRVLEGFNDGVPRTARVGQFAPNPVGLYDLSGNVCEWCEEPRKKDVGDDPATSIDASSQDGDSPAVESKDPVLRGASWSYQNPANLSAHARHRVEPTHRIDDVGFRCVLASVAPSLPGTGPENEVLQEDFSETLVEERSLPRPIHQVQPDYPTIQGNDRASGTVVLEFTVDERGRVRDPRVVRSSHAAFESSALAAVRDWRFEPAQRGGESVSTRVMQEFRFNGQTTSPLEVP